MIIFILRVFVGLLVRFFPFSACIRQCPAILLLIVCPYTSLHCVSVSFSLWISVLVLGYMSLIVRVYMYVSWSVCLSHFHSVNASICVRLYCHWLYVYRSSLRLSFSLSLFFSVSVSWYNIGKPACIRTSLDWYFFVSQCVKQCPTILSLIVGVTVHLLIRVAHSIFFPRNVFIRVRLLLSQILCV